MSNNFWQQYPLNSGGIHKKEGVYPSYFNHQRYIKDTFCRMIQNLFADRSSYAFYPSQIDYADSIFVTVSFPYDSVKFPVVTVDSMPASNVISDFQNFICDLIDDYGTTYGERYGGLIESNLSVTIYAKYTQQRDEIADIINYGIFQGKRRALESQGIVVQNVSIDSESEEDFGQDKIYTINIGAKLYSHWYSDTLYESITDVIVDTPQTPGGPNDNGPPNDPSVPIVILPGPPASEPVQASSGLSRMLEQPPCCGVCGGFLPHPNTGPNTSSEFYKAATGMNGCSCNKP